ncbi:uncharacterized protein LOC131656044 isoform X2 [Vicia villosa]|uniref:uncharacterized protein LOC131656044 isoform X2 n=1 Tax=Vicia villosa TaxID=3911 RepID=UPI00273C6292|nr:uncharacterized protein LOC131656044 isoform X2 [Vicia villosa]
MMQLSDAIATNSTTLSYWLNWRVYLCVLSVLLCMVLASFTIWKRESSRNLTFDKRENQHDRDLCGDEVWKPCLKNIHPVCLLAFRVVSFSYLLACLIAKLHVTRGVTFHYYTQWTFTLITIYFGCGSMLSVYGCYMYRKSTDTNINDNITRIDAEQGPELPLLYQDATNVSRTERLADSHNNIQKNQIAPVWSYIFHILFQMTVNMHTVNFVLLFGDAVLNCMRIPWYGMSFFVLWTGVYVIFQWIVHACISIWWPYPFLDLASPYAPFWYLMLALMHIPCYGFFMLILEMKHYFLSKWFPSSYQC